MRLLRAELRKLNRPLLWGVTFAAALFTVLLAVGGTDNARHDVLTSVRRIPSCGALGMQPGAACTDARAKVGIENTEDYVQSLANEVHVAAQLDPVAAGAEAAGLMASLPGALALALLAGGHIGGEWSGRTLKNVLTQVGHRWRVLAAKLVSLWLAGVWLIAACWAALAVAGPVLTRTQHLANPHQSLAGAASWAGSQAARSLLVLAAFAAVGVLAAVLTRGTIGTMATAAGLFVAMLVAASLPGVGRWSPATWVQGWMGFAVGQRSITTLPTNFWSRFINADQTPPGHLLGLTGLAATLLVCMAVAVTLFRRADVA
ncbi:ABC transporter permease subunit [Streptomyces gilvus]|uniref:ABC transporter permease subunit n=1 Tax=Streptomyces gilvus TaxID=2920937 RepID=UPI001F110598|nr:ABC transporter permease subunit [Streptomyces sp. CME 23]MCH5676822.1 ABC transporter permease subunit [Streptomyces sp. CME 23]